jgi:hypothetical protein
MGKIEGKKPHGRCEYNIKMYLQAVGWEGRYRLN